MEQATRNKLRNVVTQCRKLLEESVSQTLQGQFGIYAGGKDAVHIEDESRMTHLSEEDRTYRRDLLDHFGHVKARGFREKDALDQLVREIAFTHLNRLCAYKMMEARQVYVGGQRFREAVSRGINSNGFKFYLADHPEDERLFNTGKQDLAYRNFLDWLGGLLSEEIGVLFNPNDPANRLYPRQKTLDELLDLINDEELLGIWEQDETIGWVYQYFTPKELRDKARKESSIPRNSYELSFRNQFYTPRYVVEFLTDNTLGRVWYEMRKGDTAIKDQCQYMVCRPSEVFLDEGQESPEGAIDNRDDLSQYKLPKKPVYIPHRPKKDPRELKILDPACGSGHFLLYCFDLLLTIYEEAYEDIDLKPLKQDYPTLNDLRQAVPGLILAHNLYGIDIDLRSTQIAALALWLRCQRAFKKMELKKDRPSIMRSNIVCAEPIPGEKEMLDEFVANLKPRLLGQLVEVVFGKMHLAGEAGSLLTIEEELREAIAEAKRQWQAAPKEIQLALFETRQAEPQEQQLLFDTSGITDAEFLNEAEANVLYSLEEYVSKVAKGKHLQRRLFAEDIAQGFALVDICRQRFSIILMNPPFGSCQSAIENYISTHICSKTRDLAGHFILRGLQLLEEAGTLGVVAPRSLLFLQSNETFRARALFDHWRIEIVADLGLRVMDEAWIEAAPFIVSDRATTSPVFIRVLDSDAKSADLLHAVSALHTGQSVSSTHVTPLDFFRRYPYQVVSYWLPASYIRLFDIGDSLDSQFGTIRQGLATANDFRFLRLFPEIQNECVGKTFFPFAKGGPYSPFFGLPELMVYWDENGAAYWEENSETTGKPRSNIWMLKETIKSYFKRRGLTYTRRTNSAFAPRALPENCIFADKGESIFCNDPDNLPYILGIMNSSPFQMLVKGFVANADSVQSGGAARGYVGGIIKKLPLPVPERSLHKKVSEAATELMELHREPYYSEECFPLFVSPLHGFQATEHGTLLSCFGEIEKRRLRNNIRALECSHQIETAARTLYRLKDQDCLLTESMLEKHPQEYGDQPTGPDLLKLYTLTDGEILKYLRDHGVSGRAFVNQSYHSSRKVEIISHLAKRKGSTVARQIAEEGQYCSADLLSFAASVISYSVGVQVGRWDIRIALGEKMFNPSPSPFDPLPPCSPGMLQESTGLPAEEPPDNYPLEIDWDGILVDELGHLDDIVRRVREVLELIWKDKAEAIEKETCEIFGVKTLRDYFRRPSKGGFWDDHMKRYSKSRRKAPIYWLLQSSKKNYALWLYYHRLDKDILFKAHLNYVEPKIQREENRLTELRSQRSSAGEPGKEAKKLDRDIEKQEDLLSELRDFEEKLRKVANLHLDPDLNDGVVLNIAPLHELVPWNEAKKYWDELIDGKYEWSSIGKQLRERGLISSQ